MVSANKSDNLLIEKIYEKAEKALEFGAGMPALSLIFDDHSSFTFYVERCGDFLILSLYDPDHKTYKPLLMIRGLGGINSEH